MNQDFRLRYGEWAVITGASSGLGEAFAHVLASRGIRSLLIARREEELQRVADEVLTEHGIACDLLPLDLGEASFIDTLLQACETRDVGLVVGNAAYNPLGSFLDMSKDTLMAILDINDRANLLLAHGFLPKLKARGYGGFLMVASTEAFTGMPYSACYSASKAFVLTCGEALWGEFLDTDVNITVLVPGATDTPLLASRDLGTLKVTPQPPREVAEIGLDYLGKGPYVVPGTRNRWMQRLMRCLPRAWLVRKMAPIVHGMVERSTAKQAVKKPR